MYLSCDVVYLDISSHLCVYIHKRIHAHFMQVCVCAYTAQAQTRDLRYISIWQSINTVIEYRIMMQCLMSIEMVICMFQKIAAHDLTFL